MRREEEYADSMKDRLTFQRSTCNRSRPVSSYLLIELFNSPFFLPRINPLYSTDVIAQTLIIRDTPFTVSSTTCKQAREYSAIFLLDASHPNPISLTRYAKISPDHE